MKYGYKKQLNIKFEDAVAKAVAELAKEGFGVLTQIDVKATLKSKLGVDFDQYLILGACNPKFSYQALQTEKEIGLLLPCNVIIYQNGNAVFASSILPTAAMKKIINPALQKIAIQVEQKLKRVIDNI